MSHDPLLLRAYTPPQVQRMTHSILEDLGRAGGDHRAALRVLAGAPLDVAFNVAAALLLDVARDAAAEPPDQWAGGL